MRIGVLSDIHGNLRALEAVYADLAGHAPDFIVNLGDHVSGPLQAAKTADWLMARDWVHIRGNHDRQLLDREPERMGLSDRAAHAELSPKHLKWLATLPPIDWLTDEILLCHGSPTDDLQYLLEEVEGDRARLALPEYVQEKLGDTGAQLVLCGHTHVPRLVTLPSGVRIVNPGSVGLPAFDDTWTAPHYVENGTPHARYAIIDWDRASMRVQLFAVEYDWDAAAAEAARSNRAEWAHALAKGYALRPEKGQTEAAKI